VSRKAPDPFSIDETEQPVPAGLADLSMHEAVSGLIFRCSRLESIIEKQRERETAEMRRLLLDLLEVADAMDRLSVGLRTDSREVDDSGSAGITATKRLLQAKLAGVGVVPMTLVGKTANPATADISGLELQSDVPMETVLRELTVGYWWRTTVLRRAAVIVASDSQQTSGSQQTRD
jgi:molecular chaperone GrpE (heat shock protein)